MIDPNQIVFMNYTQKQLDDAFELVRPDDNWKMPIDKVIPGGSDLIIIDAAVIYFTGSSINTVYLDDGRIHVTAAGYYMTIGA